MLNNLNSERIMKKKIKEILEQTFAYNVENDKVAQELLDLFSVSNRSICSKCGKELYKGWEQSACNFTLNLNIDCQSTKALWGEDENIGFEHPAIEEGSGYQGLKIVSGKDKDYRLCISCHRKFTKMIGDWLKNGC
jgi:ferredoxin-like protein FixX